MLQACQHAYCENRHVRNMKVTGTYMYNMLEMPVACDIEYYA